MKNGGLKRIDWGIVLVIVDQIRNNPDLKRTKLATRCNLNYHQLTRYITWMSNVNFIHIKNNSGYVFLELTQNGYEVFCNNDFSN